MESDKCICKHQLKENWSGPINIVKVDFKARKMTVDKGNYYIIIK